MHPQRRASKQYLERVLEEPVGFRQCLTHFYTLAQSLVLKLRIGRERRLPDGTYAKLPVSADLARARTLLAPARG